MPTQNKIDSVAEMTEKLRNCEIAIMSKYVGINVAKVTELRKKLREAGVDYKVYKNTLARIALREIGAEQAADFMEGPTAWAFSKDPVAPAKLLKEFVGTAPMVMMLGGVLNGKVLNKQQVDMLANLPPREILLGQVVGTIAAPMRNLVGGLSALPRNLVNVLDQVRKQKEEGGSAAA